MERNLQIGNRKLFRDIVALSTLVFVAFLGTSCKSTEKRLQGEWKVTNVYVDGKEILEIQDKDQIYSYSCGYETYTITYAMMDGSLLFDENERYRAMVVYLQEEQYDYQYCNSYKETTNGVTSDRGKWRLVGKDRIEIYSIEYDSNYECIIEELKKDRLRLRCPCWSNCSIDLWEDGVVDYVIKEVEIIAVK